MLGEQPRHPVPQPRRELVDPQQRVFDPAGRGLYGAPLGDDPRATIPQDIPYSGF
jgi:hypothetical protein